MSFNTKLFNLRKDNNLSQEKFSEIIGVTRRSVTKWESGESLPEIEKLIAISNYFNVTIDSLLKDTENCSIKITKEVFKGYDSIIKFLCEAKKNTYAGCGAETISSRTNSHDLTYSKDDLMYYDTYLGGEKFSGEEAIWKKDAPIWSMNYIGRILHEDFSSSFLKEVLSSVTEEHPYRGPLVYAKDAYSYHCIIEGDFEWYVGHEDIFKKDQKVYECNFHGGLIK